MDKYKSNRPYYITCFVIVVLVAFYLCLMHFNVSFATDIVSTVLAIVAGVAFWLQYHHNSVVNEAKFVMELNYQFISDKRLSIVEHKLEQYYALVKSNADDVAINNEKEDLKTYFDIQNKERQDLVNYLVHLEGVATLVNSGVLKIETISNLMAYRFFIAVNNPVVQDLELNKYREFYKGIEKLSDNWYDKVVPMPLEKSAWKKSEEYSGKETNNE